MITGDKSNKVNEPNQYQHNQQLQILEANTRKQFYDNNNKQERQENSRQERQEPNKQERQENSKQGRQELVVQDSPSFKVSFISANLLYNFLFPLR